MARFGSVDFDERILNAIRDDKLVIFAGAGVSMGSPSNLPSFWKLAKDIASGTGLEPTEPLDRFLGTLNNKGIDVHQRAIEPLSPEGSKPNDLHRNIIKLFRDSNRIRLITTNFDLLFEEAYKELQNDDSFSEAPNIYRAPALPQGYDFNGIVYVHGALPQLNTHRAKDMVLTDADFGRAYLTEGWARRFLVDVFREFTVLFIGYSHNDAIMNYLARALPADRLSGRFALTDEKGNWKLLGIEPIIFKKLSDSSTPYKELYGSIKQLAEVTSRGVLKWEQRMIELSRTQPVDNDSLKGEIKHILEQNETTKLFVKHIRGKEWPILLDKHGHLNALFDSQPLTKKDNILAKWLVNAYSSTHPHTLLKLILKHNLEINPILWENLGYNIGKEKSLDKETFEKWADILIIAKPTRKHHQIPLYEHVLENIAEKSKFYKSPFIALKAFMALNEYDVTASRYPINNDFSQHISVDHQMHSTDSKRIYDNYIKPNLELVATPLLTSITDRLEDISRSHEVWNSGLPFAWDRMAIEPLDTNEDKTIDTSGIFSLIDAARDTLEFLGDSDIEELETWTRRLIKSKTPILRRLSIHASTLNKIKSPDDQLRWVMDNIKLDSRPEHHEMYRAVAISYKNCKNEIRQEFIQKVIETSAISTNPDKIRAQGAFNWLTWLKKNNSNCKLAEEQLIVLKNQYPDLIEPSNVEFLYSSEAGIYIPPSPLSIDELLNTPISQNLELMLSYETKGNKGIINRPPLLDTIQEVCKIDIKWMIELINELARFEKWDSDLWRCIFRSLETIRFNKEQCSLVIEALSNKSIVYNLTEQISSFLLNLSKKQPGAFFEFGIDDRSHNLSLELWESIDSRKNNQNNKKTLADSKESTSMILTSFWLCELFSKPQKINESNTQIHERYKHIFNSIIRSRSKMGSFGRMVLASNTVRLFFLDSSWTRSQLIRLLKPRHKKTTTDFEHVWAGLLDSTSKTGLLPPLDQELIPELLDAISYLKPGRTRIKLIELVVKIILSNTLMDPNEKLIPHLFKHSSTEEIEKFSREIYKSLSALRDEKRRIREWERWVRQYFDNRSENIPPTKPSKIEIETIVNCIMYFYNTRPDAALIITKLPPTNMPNHNQIYRMLCNSSLLREHPEEASIMLTHISKCVDPNDLVQDLRAAIDQVLELVSGRLKKELEEAKALLP